MKKAIYLGALMLVTLFFIECGSSNPKGIKKDKVEEITKSENPNAYFKIIGTEPFWNIEISEDKIVYTPLEGNKIEFPYNNPIIDKVSEVRKYSTVNGKGLISITLTKGFCTDGMSDRDYDYKAVIEMVQLKKQTKIKGCGYFIANDFLTGKWILNQIKSKRITLDDETIIPFIEFDIENNTISGNAGCNGLSATFAVKNNEIKFNDISLTRMFCEDLYVENNLVSLLNEVSTYKVEGRFLKFYKGDVLEMIFERNN